MHTALSLEAIPDAIGFVGGGLELAPRWRYCRRRD